MVGGRGGEGEGVRLHSVKRVRNFPLRKRGTNSNLTLLHEEREGEEGGRVILFCHAPPMWKHGESFPPVFWKRAAGKILKCDNQEKQVDRWANRWPPLKIPFYRNYCRRRRNSTIFPPASFDSDFSINIVLRYRFVPLNVTNMMMNVTNGGGGVFWFLYDLRKCIWKFRDILEFCFVEKRL